MQHDWIHLFKSIAVAMLLVMSALDTVAQIAPSGTQREATDPLQIKLVRSKVAVEKGREILVSAAFAKPGDTLEEVATYTNTSKSTLKGFEATLPVPANTELVMASVKPANAKASSDGKTFSKLPLVQKVRQPNGVEVEQPLPLDQYRYLRWYAGELAAEKSMTVVARFKVANTPVDSVNGTK